MDTAEHREGNDRVVQISTELTRVDPRDLEKAAWMLRHARRVFIAGNGGSAASASHFASDLKAIGVNATSLCDNISVITRIANDSTYDDIFTGQIPTDLDNNDVLVLISASGNSPNVLKAAVLAREAHGIVLALLGFGGGKLRELADFSIVLSSRDYGVVEGIHLCLCHIISDLIRKRNEA